MHPAAAKIFIVNEYLQSTTDDVLVFLDTDAWVQNTKYLHKIVMKLWKTPDKHGCFSRDTYIKKNTYINSGAFVIKVNDYTKNMYKKIASSFSENPYFHRNWPFDQHFISSYIFENRKDFMIFQPEIFNTPVGIVLRHNWNKDKKMYDDLYDILHSNTYDMENALDKHEYPNRNDEVDYMTTFPKQDSPYEQR
jgi:hypothetical protein